MKNYKLVVNGMNCGKCKAKISDGLKEKLDISSVEVNLETKEVLVAGAVKGLAIKNEIAALGFEVVSIAKS